MHLEAKKSIFWLSLVSGVQRKLIMIQKDLSAGLVEAKDNTW